MDSEYEAILVIRKKKNLCKMLGIMMQALNSGAQEMGICEF